jgi:anti-sigma B factor antagonist
MTIEVDERAGVPVVTVAGEIDISTAPDLRRRLAVLLDTAAGRVVVDLQGVDFLDSTALSVLIGAHRRLQRQGGGLDLVCTRPAVLRVLHVTGLGRFFTVHGSLGDALAPRSSSR